MDFGIRCIIAPDFADIFYNNSFKNGILPIRLPRAVCDQLMDDTKLGGNARVTIDLARQVVIRPNGEEIGFEIDAFRKNLLLNGLDDIGQTLAVKEEPYIEACRAMGMSNLRILARHIFPNIAATLSALATLRVGINILTCASLSFLGLGAQAPLPEWGAMLASSRTTLLIAPHLALFPGLSILLLVFGLNLFQDGLQVVLDPKARGR